jgi:uncharacterized hydrophobic protein (TIGR00271 family)
MQAEKTSTLSRLFDLKSDQAPTDAIDAAVRSAGQVSGTNMWVLMFAIIIASVGLNVNSPATIIGAMLISPLMGPIIGTGYGAGINDFVLIRRSLRNLATFAGISLVTSTLYFWITPLQDAQSELLARTTPNLWDVLIAFFGGAAGMVGLTRKEKSTTIPGVAIATALMPPLCTVGYGIATGQPRFFLGALFLFTINGVFIALATLTITKVLKLPQHKFADAAASVRARWIIGAIVTATLVPSVFLAAKMVQAQVFTNEAERYVRSLSESEKSLFIASHQVNAESRAIDLYVIGAESLEAAQKSLDAKRQAFQLQTASVNVHLASAGQRPDAGRPAQQKLDQQLAQIRALQGQLESTRSAEAAYSQVAREIEVQYPQFRKVSVARELRASDTPLAKASLLVVVESTKPLPRQERIRLEKWLAVRLPANEVRLLAL